MHFALPCFIRGGIGKWKFDIEDTYILSWHNRDFVSQTTSWIFPLQHSIESSFEQKACVIDNVIAKQKPKLLLASLTLCFKWTCFKLPGTVPTKRVQSVVGGMHIKMGEPIRTGPQQLSSPLASVAHTSNPRKIANELCKKWIKMEPLICFLCYDFPWKRPYLHMLHMEAESDLLCLVRPRILEFGDLCGLHAPCQMQHELHHTAQRHWMWPCNDGVSKCLIILHQSVFFFFC